MKKLMRIYFLPLLFISCNPAAPDRQQINNLSLLPHQCIDVDSVHGELMFTNTVSMKSLANKDSLAKDATVIAGRLLEALAATKSEVIQTIKIFYMDKYSTDPASGVFYGASLHDDTLTEFRLTNSSNPVDTSLLLRAHRYALAPDEFLLIKKGVDFTFFKNVDIATVTQKKDSLQKLSYEITHRLFYEVIRGNCSDFKAVTFCLQDRHNTRKLITLRYPITNCRLEDTPHIHDLSGH